MLLPDTALITPVPPCEDVPTGICITVDEYHGRDGLWLTVNGYPDVMTPIDECPTTSTWCALPPRTEDTSTWLVIMPALVHDVNLGA
jgi:hypothetical protein